jgi:spermidine synthase
VTLIAKRSQELLTKESCRELKNILSPGGLILINFQDMSTENMAGSPVAHQNTG